MIRADELKQAIRWFLGTVCRPEVLDDPTPELAAAELAESDWRNCAVAFAAEPGNDGVLRLNPIHDRLSALTAGALKGDGMLSEPAVQGSGAEALWREVPDIGAGGGGHAALLESSSPMRKIS